MVFIAVVAALTGCAFSDRPQYHGLSLDPPLENDGFELISADGPVSADDFAGQYVALFFGYTNCPDVCPATLSVLRRALSQLDPDMAERVRVAFVSVDPERDTPARLVEYTSAFDDSFVGLTGTDEQISRVASSFGIYYGRAEGSDASDYLVDHTASVLLLDPNGDTRMMWSYGTDAEQIAEDLRNLLR
ncbi:MAG: SCO family protein [Rhodothermales bacterium]